MPASSSGRIGSEGALQKLQLSSPPREDEVAELHRILTQSVARICPRWLVDHAEDITHNAVMQLLGSLEKSGGTREFSSIYLRKAAHGALVDEIRRRCRRKEDAMSEGLARDVRAEAIDDPERIHSAAEIGHGIAVCLARLIESRRLAVTLFLRGCSVPEAARRLGWSAKKTEHLLRRGLASLRECLARKGFEP